MKLNKLKFVTSFGLLLICQQSWAQSGYNYARPEAGPTTPSITNQLQTNSIRPIISAFPTGSTATGAFPTPTTAYGASANPIQANVSPPTSLSGIIPGGYVGQAQRGAAAYTPSTATIPVANSGFAGVGGTTGPISLPKRPGLGQRPSSGIYGASTALGGGVSGQAQYTGRGTTGTGTGSGLDEDYDGDFSAIPGIPGVDYPIYSQVPRTNFDCAQQPLPGYYSDVEAQCQVFHICALNRTYSFLCPNGTLFSQETLVCVWWNQYDCASAPALYANNAYIYDYGERTQPTQVGVGGIRQQQQQQQQQQPSYTPANAGRQPQTSNAGIYGSSQNLRPTVIGGNYPGVSPNVYQTTATANNVAGRFGPRQQNAQVAQTFPTAAALATPPPFGAVIRPEGGGTTNTGGDFGQTINAYPNVQLTAAATNREYLPPRRP